MLHEIQRKRGSPLVSAIAGLDAAFGPPTRGMIFDHRRRPAP
jgi:hypothetical protein